MLLKKVGEAGEPRPAVAIARALVRSPVARKLPGFVVAVREAPTPLIVLAGRTSLPHEVYLRQLTGLLEEAGERVRFLAWPDVEKASSELAGQVEGVLGPSSVDARIVAVPRGGLIVAALVAYAMEVPASRVGSLDSASAVDPETATPPVGPLILVDDVALSGVRLREALGLFPQEERIVIATLASHPDLRAAVLEASPQVEAFVSSIDLEDHAPRLLGAASDSWRSQWSERVPDRYHTALLDLIILPWSEPPLRLWNELEGRLEEGWRIAPPELCFRTRHCPPAIPLQVVDRMAGVHRLMPKVIPVELDDRTLILVVGEDNGASKPPSFALRGTAREIWQLWLEAGREAAVEGMQRRYPDVDPDRIRGDVEVLLAQLSEAGIVRRGG